jgi:hypothetical protein
MTGRIRRRPKVLRWDSARRRLLLERRAHRQRPQQSLGAPRFAVCVKNDGYGASLELNKIYLLVDDAEAESEGDLRVVDESGEDYLYPEEWFVRIQVPSAVEESLLKIPASRSA